MSRPVLQQISYIAPAAPARRQSATGDEPYIRPEIGFTPKWFRTALGIDFGKKWHVDPAYRRETVIAMRNEIRKRFPGSKIGDVHKPDKPLDLLTGLYGGNFVAMIFGIPAIYAEDNWPTCAHQYLSDEEADKLEPPDLDTNPVYQDLNKQVDWIAKSEGQVLGHINWQGILNVAHRLRGEKLFYDMFDSPPRCKRVFDAIYYVMSEGCKRLYAKQKKTGVNIDFYTVSNCLVNMISPQQYEQYFLEYDVKFGKEFGALAIHNCAWNADPYIELYSKIDTLGYVDMGSNSDLERVRRMIPNARRAYMYTPMALANNSWEQVESDIRRIADQYGPCDLVIADIEADTPDEKIKNVLDLCKEISSRKETK
ncbi:MAG: hypothetical protein E4H40_00745 [Candidatus Brocadiia bacterium]|nr:MAG: hypothetical protein E4H40_00745 [Candidatus Brocadiia bacterium]